MKSVPESIIKIVVSLKICIFLNSIIIIVGIISDSSALEDYQLIKHLFGWLGFSLRLSYLVRKLPGWPFTSAAAFTPKDSPILSLPR